MRSTNNDFLYDEIIREVETIFPGKGQLIKENNKEALDILLSTVLFKCMEARGKLRRLINMPAGNSNELAESAQKDLQQIELLYELIAPHLSKFSAEELAQLSKMMRF